MDNLWITEPLYIRYAGFWAEICSKKAPSPAVAGKRSPLVKNVWASLREYISSRTESETLRTTALGCFIQYTRTRLLELPALGCFIQYTRTRLWWSVRLRVAFFVAFFRL